MTVIEDNFSILLVEDDTDDETLILSTLARNGLQFRHCRVDNADDFQDRLANDTWDLVITDFKLPTFSATAVLDILRSGTQDVPCIVISGYIDEAAAVSLLKAGAHDFISKNNLARLVPAIRREVTESRNRQEKTKVETSLRQKEKLLADLACALGEGLIISSVSGDIIFINPEAQYLLGWGEEQILGKNLHQTVCGQTSDCVDTSQLHCKVTRFPVQGVPIRSEDKLFMRQDGSRFNASFVSTQIIEDGMVVAVVTAFQDITQRKQAERDLIESRIRYRELSNFLQDIREKERTRIARELHDELGQTLTALKMDLSWIVSNLGDDNSGLLGRADEMLKLLDTTVDSVRRIAANLRPSLLDDLGLSVAVEWLLEEFKKRTGILYLLDISHDEFDFSPELSTALFRIVQEAITNIARHAQASQLSVTLREQGDAGIFLAVKDNGIGFAPQNQAGKSRSFGLLGIQERIFSLGGRFEMDSQVGSGTELRVYLPKPIDLVTGETTS